MVECTGQLSKWLEYLNKDEHEDKRQYFIGSKHKTDNINYFWIRTLIFFVFFTL